jgi:putative ABC transport system permease protein
LPCAACVTIKSIRSSTSAAWPVSILLLFWVNDELSYDRFNVHAAYIYKLSPKFDDQNIWYTTPAPIAVYAKKDVPEVEDACRIADNGRVSVFEYNGKKIGESHNGLVDASFFNIFTFPLAKGNPQHPFDDAYAVVLSETAVKTIFGDEDPMGKVVTGDDKKIYHVTGVMKDMPANSSIHYNAFFNFQQLEQEYDTTNHFKIAKYQLGPV